MWGNDSKPCNSFSISITCLHRTIIWFLLFIVYVSGLKYIIARQIFHFSLQMCHNARQSDDNIYSLHMPNKNPLPKESIEVALYM